MANQDDANMSKNEHISVLEEVDIKEEHKFIQIYLTITDRAKRIIGRIKILLRESHNGVKRKGKNNNIVNICLVR